MIGGDILVKDRRYRDSVDSNTRELFFNPDQSKQIGVFTAIVLLLNSGIGTDPFFMGHAFQCGIFQALLMCAVTIFLTLLSFALFVRTWLDGSKFSYSGIWRSCFGPALDRLPVLMLVLAYLSITILLTDEVHSNMKDILMSFNWNCPSILVDKWFLSYVMSFLTAFFPLLCPKFVGLAGISYVADIGLVVGMIVIVAKFVASVTEIGFDPQKRLIWWGSDFSMSVECFGCFNTVFFVHPAVVQVAQGMKNPTRTRVTGALWTATFFNAFINLLTGYCTYLTFFDGTSEDNALFSFGNDWATILGKVGCYMSVIFTNSVYVYLATGELMTMVYPDVMDAQGGPLAVSKLLSGVVMITLNVATVFFPLIVLEIFGLVGNMCFIFTAFILPPVFFIKLFGTRFKLWFGLSVFLLVVCIPISVGLIAMEIMALIG